MFHTVIQDIIELQNSKKKKIMEEDLAGPQTYDNLASARKQIVGETEPPTKPSSNI